MSEDVVGPLFAFGEYDAVIHIKDEDVGAVGKDAWIAFARGEAHGGEAVHKMFVPGPAGISQSV